MPKTLLLADDSVTIQKVVGITFANEDVELVTVDNGDDALVKARQVKPDLVLADIGMPGLTGYELCAAIRRDPNLSHVPVLLLTGTFETYDENRAREVGASGHIAKPFEAQALVDRVFQLLAQAPPKPAAPPAPAPAPQAPARPAAAPAAPPRPAAAAQSGAQSQPPRARPELPPVPHAPTPVPKPAPAAAAPVKPVIPQKRESQPFEFELPSAQPAVVKPVPPVPPTLVTHPPKAAPAPMKPAAPPPAPPAAADQEPIWEAEPEAEVLSEEPAEIESFEQPAPAPTAEPTRLFAPDLLGRATQLPDVPEPPRPPARKGDFSFEDLDFEEPTNPANHQSGIFGESSDASHEFEPDFAQPVNEAEPAEVEALADPLYSQTTFLDPASRAGAPSSAPVPDLLAATPQPRPAPSFEAETEEELELSEPELAGEDEEETPLPFSQPFSPDTAAALDEPLFERTQPPSAARTAFLAEESETPVPTRLTMPAPTPRVTPRMAEADTLPPTPRRAPAPPMPVPAPATAAPVPRSSGAVVDSGLLAQSVEKVAWEAFGALSEQVVGEVLKRVEAVVWEVVPQLCERLIREEIARLKAEMSE